jgi:hypothetical protein
MDQWWPMPWFPAFPFLFMLLCLAVFLFIMVPMMRRHMGWRDRRDDTPFREKAALDILRLQHPGLPCRDVVCFDLDLAWS